MFVVVLVYIPCFDLIRALLLRHAGAQRIVILGAAPGNISLCISPLLVAPTTGIGWDAGGSMTFLNYQEMPRYRFQYRLYLYSMLSYPISVLVLSHAT